MSALVVIVAGLQTLRPILWSAYAVDDIWASQSPAYLTASGTSLWDSWVSSTTQWMLNQGRFFPGTTADWTLVYATFTTRESYKAFQLAIAVAAIVTFVVWVSRAVRTAWAGLLVAILVLACTQFRFFFDPLLHFAGELPLLVLAMFGSLIVLQAFLRARRPHAVLVVVALVLWALALTTYESSYLVAPAALLTIAVEPAPRPRKIWAAVGVALPTLLLGAFVAILRSRVSHPLEVYSTSLDPTTFFPTLGKQLVATLPLSYTWFRHGVGIPSLSHALAPTPAALILVMALTAVTAVALLRVPRFPRAQVVAMAVLGASLMLAASSVTAVSAYWQHSLVLGDAYIGVFMQTLGLSLVGLAALSLRPRPTAAWARHSTVAAAVVCGLALGWTVVATSQQNARVVTASDPRLGSWASQPQLGFPRALTSAAFERGLLVGDPSKGTVYGNPGGPWFNSTFLSYAAHRAVRVPNQWPFWSLAPDATTRLPGCARVGPCEPAAGPVYTVTVRAASYERGVVVLARAVRIDQLDPQPTDASVTAEQARVYLSGYEGPSRPCARTQGGAGPLVVSPTKQRVVSTGADWTIVDVTFAAPGIPVSSIGELSGSSCL